ncbi:MAG: hypothetical protein R3E89_11755 [Thiolinea sp.]
MAVAFHAGLFNIGGEGQAYIGGLGVGLICLGLGDYLPGLLLIPLATCRFCPVGCGLGLNPGYLQAYRGSYIVITTIMFNFLASSLMVYLLVNQLSAAGQMTPASRSFAESTHLPFWQGNAFGRPGILPIPRRECFPVAGGAVLHPGVDVPVEDALGL